MIGHYSIRHARQPPIRVNKTTFAANQTRRGDTRSRRPTPPTARSPSASSPPTPAQRPTPDPDQPSTPDARSCPDRSPPPTDHPQALSTTPAPDTSTHRDERERPTHKGQAQLNTVPEDLSADLVRLRGLTVEPAPAISLQRYAELAKQLAFLRLAPVTERLAPALEAAERQARLHRVPPPAAGRRIDAVEQRRLQGRLRFAKLPARKTIEQSDFSTQPSLDRRLVEELATLRPPSSSGCETPPRLRRARRIGSIADARLAGPRVSAAARPRSRHRVRIVVRNGFSRDLARVLLDELTGAVQRLEQQDRRGRPQLSPAFHH